MFFDWLRLTDVLENLSGEKEMAILKCRAICRRFHQ